MTKDRKRHKPCGCCEGVERLPPQPVVNRPGLDKLAYRVGTHARFLETMKACLSSSDYPALGTLTTREASDPSIALLDGWAMVGDVLTFYQERIANEGYLRTATERRSILELGRLVGYRLRPGVAATAYLAFELEEDREVEIPAGTRAQSVPGPDEDPQFFETSEPLLARAEWNELKPRLTQPQRAEEIILKRTIYFQGIDTGLQPNDPLLIVVDGADEELKRVCTVELEKAADRTRVTFGPWIPEPNEGNEEEDQGVTPSEPHPKLLPQHLKAGPLRELITSLEDMIGICPENVRTLAEALLELFRLLIMVPSSPASAREIRATILALDAVRDGLDAGFHPSLFGDFVEELRIWIDAASDLLGSILQEGGGHPAGMQVMRGLDDALQDLRTARPLSSIPPRSPRHLPQDAAKRFVPGSDAVLRALAALQPALAETLYEAVRNLSAQGDPGIQVYAFRARAAPFGHNALPRPDCYADGKKMTVFAEWKIDDPLNYESTLSNGQQIQGNTNKVSISPHHTPSELYLDADYDIQPDSWVVIDRKGKEPVCVQPEDMRRQSFMAYGLSGKTARLDLGGKTWFEEGQTDFTIVRETVVHVQSEELTLAEAPMEDPIGGQTGDAEDSDAPVSIELDGVYEGLEPGRWLILHGERVRESTEGDEIGAVSTGVLEAELVMLDGIQQGYDETLPGDRYHTTLTLANSLANIYKRDTVTIYGNVVKATHGETREEVLGSGNGSLPLQSFPLAQAPLTYLAAPTAAGAESTLEVRANDLEWHEAPNLTALGPTDRRFITQIDDQDETVVTFGDGHYGRRLPTGTENIEAVYRKGIGRAGNVKAEQISQLITKPLGVKNVINPLPASGGANRESRDQARRNTPIGVMALDHLVSVPDYAYFARSFAGIGKASAVMLSDGNRQLVHLTIAGAGDIPIDASSDLYRNLVLALRRCGDPYQPFEVELRESMLLVVDARVRLLPDYLWDAVEPEIREKFLEAFSFDRRELGQDAVLSEVLSVIQAVEGVDYVDVEAFDSVDGNITAEELEQLGDDLRRRERIVVELARIQSQHTVRWQGETYTSVASRYGVRVEDLWSLNPVPVPVVGHCLCIVPEEPDQSPTHHRVLAEETIASIAAKYGITENELRERNSDITEAMPGDCLRIVAEDAGVDPTHHKVEQGDTYANIAVRYQTTVEQLRSLNPELEIGDCLHIPPTIRPAQLAYLSPDTLFLTEVE